MFKVVSIDGLKMIKDNNDLLNISFTIIDSDKPIKLNKNYNRTKINNIINWFNLFPNKLYYEATSENFEVK